jgi:hypothetical protein
MYYVITWGLMVVIPAISVLIEQVMTPGADLLLLIAKWFVFWGIGIRLLIAGIRQVLQPAFTARTIFRMEDPSAEKLVIEIGFGNLAIGLVASLSLLWPAFVVPLGLTGGLFLGLAGLRHMANANRTAEENAALVTDLIIGVIGVGTALLLLFR